MHVHQFHPTVSYGDAIGNHMTSLQRMAGALGYNGELFCEHLPLHHKVHARQITEYSRYAAEENVLLVHFSLGYSPAVLDWLQDVPDRKVLIYHNITPHTYFKGINEGYYEAARTGREQLPQLRPLVDAAWGDSEYNCQELAECGWKHLGVLPIAFDPQLYAVKPDRNVLRAWQDSTNILFVGRVAPNKCIEDLILTFYYLKRYVRPEARLVLVGSSSGMEPYWDYLQALVKRLNLNDVTFTGHVSNEAMVAYYRCASIYLSMSEHEGFGMPFLESMHFGVPIVAYKAAAVPETLGDSGVLITQKNHAAVAELIGLLLEDDVLREGVIARQRARLPAFTSDRVQARLADLLHSLPSGSKT